MAEAFAVSPVDMYLRAKHRLAGQFARFESDNPAHQVLVCRNLPSGVRNNAYGAKLSLVELTRKGLNAWRWESCLERAYRCARLACGEDPPAVGGNAVAQNKCQWKAGEGAYLASCC